MLAGTYDSFSPSHICVHAGLGSSIGTISPWESKLAMFRKEGKKTWELKLVNTRTLKFKSSETWNTQNRSKSLILNPLKWTCSCFLRGPLRWLNVAEKPKIQRSFWHRRSRVIRNSCKGEKSKQGFGVTHGNRTRSLSHKSRALNDCANRYFSMVLLRWVKTVW